MTRRSEEENRIRVMVDIFCLGIATGGIITLLLTLWIIN